MDNMSNYLQRQLKLQEPIVEDFNKEYDLDKFEDREDLDSIPIKGIFIDESHFVDMTKWFDFLEEMYGKEDSIICKIGDKRYIGIKYYDTTEADGEEEVRKYEIITSSDFYDKISENYDSNNEEDYPDDYEFIKLDEYKQKSIQEIVKILFRDGDSVSILRRNFRVGDIVKSNTKLGNLDSWEVRSNDNKSKTIKTLNPIHKYIDFSGSYESEKSISKMILTDNGKKLKMLLDNLRGYVINNFVEIKKDFKKNTAKFKGHIDTFRNIDIDDLKVVDNFDPNSEININVSISYGYTNRAIKLSSDEELKTVNSFFEKFETMENFAKLIGNKDDIDYLKNFVNLKGSIKTSRDYNDFKRLILHIGGKDIFKYKEAIKYIVSIMDSIKLDKETEEELTRFFDSNRQEDRYSKLKPNLPGMKELILKTLHKYYPNLKISRIDNIDFDAWRVDINLIVDL